MKKFTLIELLVVVAIIGILVSILVPSLGKARYKARLAVCLSNLKQMAIQSYVYTDNNDDSFPTRNSVGLINFTANQLTNLGDDMRDPYREMFGELREKSIIQCPLLTPLDLENVTAGRSYMHYYYMGGWKYSGESSGMLRINDNVLHGGEEYNILGGDFIEYDPSNTFSTHPAKNLSFILKDNSTVLNTRYENTSAGNVFGGLDLNFLKTDGSAKTYSSIDPNDSRFDQLPRFQHENSSHKLYLPKE